MLGWRRDEIAVCAQAIAGAFNLDYDDIRYPTATTAGSHIAGSLAMPSSEPYVFLYALDRKSSDAQGTMTTG